MQASAIQQLVYSRGFGKMAASEVYYPKLPPPPPAGAPIPLPIDNSNSNYPTTSISPSGTMEFSPPPVDTREFIPLPEPRETGSLIPAASGGSGTLPNPAFLFDPPAKPEVSLMDGIKSLYHRAKNKYNSLSDNQRLGLGIGAGVLGGAGILGAMELYRKRQQEEEEHKMRMRAFRGY